MDEKNLAGTEDELSEILLVLNEDEKELRVVKGIKNGELETVPAEKMFQGQFLKVNFKDSAFKNFWSNFVRELKNSSKVKLFKIRLPDLEKVKEAFKHNTSEKEKIIKENQLEIPGELKQDQRQEQGQEPITNLNNENKMETTEGTPTEQREPSEVQNELRYKPEEIDWNGLRNYGIDREQLEKNGVLDEMCRGFKSPYTFPIRLNTDQAAINFDARLFFMRQPDDKVKVMIDGIRSYPKFEQTFFGHEFTDEDKLNLRTTGNMGRIVEIKDYRSDKMVPSVISIDKITNQIVAYPAEKMKIPEEYRKMALTDEQKSDLKEGKFVKVDGMVNSKNETFDGYVQYNAERKYLEIVFPARILRANTQKLDAPAQDFRGYTFSKEEYGTLLTGDAVQVKLLKKDKSDTYKGFVRFNQEKGEMEFSYKNPNKVEVNPVSQVSESTKEQQKADKQKDNRKEKKNKKGRTM